MISGAAWGSACPWLADTGIRFCVQTGIPRETSMVTVAQEPFAPTVSNVI